MITQLAESKGLSRRTAQRTVQQAYALIREDIDQCNVERTDLVAQAIHLLMESARMGLAQNNPGAVLVLYRSWTSCVGCLLPDGSSSCGG